jgi:hypothetical protein
LFVLERARSALQEPPSLKSSSPLFNGSTFSKTRAPT